jgi:hypothetical protein
VPVRHQLHTGRHLDPDHVRTGLRRLTDDDGEARRSWERRERFPINVFRQDRSEDSFTRLMRSSHGSPPDLECVDREILFLFGDGFDLAKLLTDRGARALLGPMFAQFTEGFDRADLKAARARLADLD